MDKMLNDVMNLLFDMLEEDVNNDICRINDWNIYNVNIVSFLDSIEVDAVIHYSDCIDDTPKSKDVSFTLGLEGFKQGHGYVFDIIYLDLD